MIFSAVRDWKTTIHCVVWILSIFFGLFILLMPTQARDYHIRASDGEEYTVTLGETPDINNFSVRKSNGEILRGVTEAERATTAELYFAAKLFWHILPLYSLDAPVEDLDAWVTDIAKIAIIKLLVQQGADILLDGAVNGFLGTVQLLLGGNVGSIVDGWIPAAINDAVEKDAEQRLLIDAANLAKSFAATAVDHENMLRDFYLSYETRSVLISIDEINTAWESFYIVVECKSLTTNLIHKYLQDPKSEISLELGSLGSIAVSLLPAGKTTTTIAKRVVTTTDFIGDVTDAIETIDSVNYTQDHIEKLQRVRENAGSWIYQQVLSDINEKKRELRGTLDQVGYFQPMIAPTVNVPPPDEPSPEQIGTIPNENETEVTPLPNHPPEVYRQINPQNFRVGDDPKWRNLSSYFSDPDGDILIYKANSSNDRIADAMIEGRNSVKITPGEVGTATVTVTAEDPAGLIEEQSFRVTVQTRPPIPQTIPSLPVCDRTPQVREEIMKRTRDNNCAKVTEDELESIRRLSIINEGLITLQQGDFDELRNLEDLVLNENSLRTLPEDVFWYLGELEELSLRDNQITTLVKDTFEHLDSLTYLTLRGNPLATLQQGAFDDLEMLIELDLSDNQLITLPTGVFEDLFNLEELNLENNHITTLSSGGFLGLSSLEDLYLDENPLQTIKAGAFSGLDSLTDLNFYSYPLRTIEAGAFSGLNSLTDLDLGNAQLRTLQRDVFSGLSSLEDLYLHKNPLQTIEAGAFSGLDSLTYLNLDDTQLQTIEAGAFSGLDSLTDLDLGNAQLRTLQRDVFSGLSSLERLDLDENPLQTIETGAFSGLDSLTDLYLYNTQLRTLQRDVFSGLSSLEDLDLDEGTLRVIEVGAFNGLSNLISLDLSENQLNTLPVGIFSGLSSLMFVNLRSNPGAPFTLTLELARTDNTNLEAAGPATVKVTLAEGAPFDMNIRLSIEGGTLSVDIVTLTRGQTESDPITIRQNGTRVATVRLEIAPTIPQGYRGIQMAVGSPLTLFSDALPEEPALISDVNRDGTVNILDLVFVASKFGETDAADADLNADGQVNIQDLVIVANSFGDVAAGPSPETLDASLVQH